MSMNLTPDKLSKAVALFYDGKEAPVVSAKGEGLTAEEIIKVAQENDVPLCDNAALVELLAQLELGDSIPHSLYTAVAHIIAFAYKLQLDLGKTY
ncbi:EscU/YscU/HrcU family type III secretion system export apparatus switch protein [Teredinibacter sp. KSP-S5-2]|uniref:EscU/YscU/HrcU family type III secretion system export apparatus switch protein n=1 Tax=Teredinibacter sp. KSP-S5-2 TaxID=3034506 RepID=UPI003977D8CB